MALYRFVGGYVVCEDLPQKELRAFGQQIDISEDLADECIAHRRIDLVTESEFAEQGVTAEEMKKYSDAKHHGQAPEEFKTKKAALLTAAQTHRAALLAPTVTA